MRLITSSSAAQFWHSIISPVWLSSGIITGSLQSGHSTVFVILGIMDTEILEILRYLMQKSKKGIWQFASLLSEVAEPYCLSLGEGSTREVEFGDGVFLKREDENPTGSLKDRGMAFLISWAFSRGFKNFVLSSSGNAAISALSYCRLAGLNLRIFVSKKTNTAKMRKIEELGGEITVTERAVSEAEKFAKENGFFNLRPSVNPLGPEGYKTIAFELAQSSRRISDIFLPVSSGVCLIGLYQGFKESGFLPRLHACQSSANAPLASFFDKDFVAEKRSLATALVAKSLPLKEKILSAVRESGGSGWVIGNEEIKTADEDLRRKNIITSFEGVLSLAAVRRAEKKGCRRGETVCLLTGKRY